jgi:hypothetical protein
LAKQIQQYRKDHQGVSRRTKRSGCSTRPTSQQKLPRRSGEVLFEIIMRRYETRSTMMTSNRPLEKRHS